MSEREKQSEFLKNLIITDESGLHQQVYERIQKAEHDEKCVRLALIIVSLLAMAALAGLGYSAVLLPGFFDGSTPPLVKLFCALGLGSLISIVVFTGYWLWYRGIANKVHEECRRLIMDDLYPQEDEALLRSVSLTRDGALPD